MKIRKEISMKNVNVKGWRKIIKKITSFILVIAIIGTSIGMDNFTKKVKGADSYMTLYLKDDTQQHWLENDNAVIEMVDNTFGHDHYIMNKVDNVTWSVKVPSSTYNVTFNRLSPDKGTQWNSWSAGGRDNHSTYHATVPEHGYWDGTAEVDEGFHEGDIIYLDYYEFKDWGKSDAQYYVNFTESSKADNGNQDIKINQADSKKYSPVSLSQEVEEQVYKYVVTKEDEGRKKLRFWRGNTDSLWNCSVALSYSDYKAGNNCVKVKNWDDSGYVCPYVPRRHKTRIDSITLDVEGKRKVNRKLDVDLNVKGETELLLKDRTEICISRIDSGGKEIIPNEGEILYRIDDSASEWNHRELIFTKAGTYKLSGLVTDGVDTFTADTLITVSDDNAPQALFNVSSENVETSEENVFVRDEKGTVNLLIQDKSISELGDEISARLYKVYYDKDGDGEYAEEELINSSDNNETELRLECNNVGKYKIILNIKESFKDTIVSLIDETSYLGNSYEEEFEICNQAPVSSISIEKSRTADIVFTTGSADKDTLSKYAEKTEKVKEQLEEQGIKAKVSTVSTSAFTAKDTFAWKEYDHCYYEDDLGETLPKHILCYDKDIKMLGYYYAPMKDFLFIPDENKCTKIFEFDLQRDNTDWHSMEGGGFLFNTTVSDEENYIQGYCILVTQSGLRISKVNRTDLSQFRYGALDYVYQFGELIQEFPLEDVYANHHLILAVNDNNISIYDGDKMIVNNYALPDDGLNTYGYGPITSHLNHWCSQKSYFTFKNIVMQTITGESLSDVVNNHEWTPGTNHYVINLSDTSVPELSDNDNISEVAASLTSKDAMFFGIGSGEAEEQYNSLLNLIDGRGENIELLSKSDDTGIVNGVDVSDGVDQIVSSIKADIESKDYSIGNTIATDEEVEYKGTYADPENDPIGKEEWKYVYDSSVFGETSSEKKNIEQESPITMFTDSGAYEISHVISDNPTGDNTALEGYTRWSDTDNISKLILSQHRPTANIQVSVTQASDDEQRCLVNAIYSSEDVDHMTDSRKGIRAEKFSYMKLGDLGWTEGKMPSQVDMGTTYLVKYIVTDIEGTQSRPAVVAVKTSEAKKYVKPVDTEAPEVYLSVSEQTVEVGKPVYIETSAQDNYGIIDFSVKCN